MDVGIRAMQVIYARPPGRGWAPIAMLARLTADLLQAPLTIVHADRLVGRGTKALAAVPRRRRGTDVLLIAPQPGDLDRLLDVGAWIAGRGRVAAWVIDSWWTDRIPRSLRVARHIDHVYVTESADVATWQSRSGAPVSWLPIGADVLGHLAPSAPRDITLQRVGRQPAEWDDDDGNNAALARAGLTYRGRLPFGATDEQAHGQLHDALQRARFVLAFSNGVSGAEYTHPVREYLTPRWADALAAGCVVAGVSPQTAGVGELLWPGALLELNSTDRRSGIEVIAEANHCYSPRIATTNQLHALNRLDWRHRLATIASDFGVDPAPLAADHARITDAVAMLSAAADHGEARS